MSPAKAHSISVVAPSLTPESYNPHECIRIYQEKRHCCWPWKSRAPAMKQLGFNGHFGLKAHAL
jgi:hypothetical protein